MTSTNVDPRRPLYFAFLAMPFVMGALAYFLVPSANGEFATVLPDGSNVLHWGALALAVALTAGSVAVGFLGDAMHRQGGRERRDETVAPRWLIRLGMGEMVAMLGFVVTFVLQRPGAWLPFSILSLVALVFARPN